MPEINMRNNPWNPGIPIDPATIARDIYLLLTIFTASKEICGRRKDELDEGSVYGYSIRAFELPEVGRLLVSLSATCRNAWDQPGHSIEDALNTFTQSAEVGTLIKDIKVTITMSTPLMVRESWNKVLHCHTINFERSEGSSIYSGHLEPHVHLYGEYQGKEWKASVDIFRWCEVVYSLTL